MQECVIGNPDVAIFILFSQVPWKIIETFFFKSLVKYPLILLCISQNLVDSCIFQVVFPVILCLFEYDFSYCIRCFRVMDKHSKIFDYLRNHYHFHWQFFKLKVVVLKIHLLGWSADFNTFFDVYIFFRVMCGNCIQVARLWLDVCIPISSWYIFSIVQKS